MSDRSEVREGQAGKDENPIQRAPKPEMLEKAREVLRAQKVQDLEPDNIVKRVALALEEAVRVEVNEHAACERAKNAALRASEASVESLSRVACELHQPQTRPLGLILPGR